MLKLYLFILFSLIACTTKPSSPDMTTPVNDVNIHTLGRVHFNPNQSATLSYPGAGFRLTTNARSVHVRAYSTGQQSYMALRVDDNAPQLIRLSTSPQNYRLLLQGSAEVRIIELIHNSETWHGTAHIEHFELEGGELLPFNANTRRRILFIGDSVTCGEGAGRDGTQDCNKDNTSWSAHQSYGWLTGEALDAEVQLVCYGGRGLIRSWDGNTKDLNGPDYYQLTIPEPGAPQWDHKRFEADAVVVSLGTNDFSLGIGELPAEQDFVPAYVNFVKTILEHYPQAQVVITDGSIVNDGDPSRPQKTVLRRYLAMTQSQVSSKQVHVFEASHFPGDRCDGHPTGPQHKAMSEELVTFFQEKLNW